MQMRLASGIGNPLVDMLAGNEINRAGPFERPRRMDATFQR